MNSVKVFGKLGFALAYALVALALSPALAAYASSQAVDLCSSFEGMAVHRGEGIPLKVTVCVSPGGTGRVTIRGVSYDSTVAESLKEALYASAWYLRLDPWDYDYNVVVEPYKKDIGSISGTSLSLTVFVAAMSALTGSNLSHSIVATGTVNPDMTVGFVGLVREKAAGAEKWGFDSFIYPVLQDKVYIVEEGSRHYGPYAYRDNEVKVLPANLTDFNLTLYSVAWAPQAYYVASGYGYAQPSITLDEILEKAPSLKTPNALIGVYTTVKSRTLEYLEAANATLHGQGLATIEPWVLTYSLGLVANATKALSYAEKLISAGEQLAAVEYALYAYQKASSAYYFLKLLVDGARIAGSARVDIESTRLVAERMLERAISNPSVYMVSELALASMNYKEGLRIQRKAEFDLGIVELNGLPGKSMAYTLSQSIADTLYSYAKTMAYASLVEAAPEGPKANLTAVADRLVEYAEHLYAYSRGLVYASGVPSELVTMAGSSLWKARTILSKAASDIDYLASIGYAMDSISYSSTYMALHPGFKEIPAARYPYALATLSGMLTYTGYDPMIIYELSVARLYGNLTDRLYHVERAIVHAKLLSIALETAIPAEAGLESWGEPVQYGGGGGATTIGLVVAGAIAAVLYALSGRYLGGRGRMPRIPFLTVTRQTSREE